ncbi:MAG: hypothetical protein ACREBN_07430, partial [Burkholderiaceae bacterium]
GQLNLAIVAVLRGQPLGAAAWLRQVAHIVRETGSRAAAQSLLEVSSGLAALVGDWECSAEFYGAGEAQSERSQLVRDAADQAFVNRVVQSMRAALGSAAPAAEQRGRALDCEEAIERASAWLAASFAEELDLTPGK